MHFTYIVYVVVYLRLIRAQHELPEAVPGVLPGADDPVFPDNPPDPDPDAAQSAGEKIKKESTAAPEGEAEDYLGETAVNQSERGVAHAAEAEAGDAESDEEYTSQEETTVPKDSHTFVALIDIVFTDGCKRTCTGAIIHENVVITAAHCFTMYQNKFTQPELSMSFVVIGNKAMFDTGYEQYLPIERVVTHPRYKGWTADLALVYTFANMMSDKPGQILNLASEKSTTPVDSNVTVLSWGQCQGDINEEERAAKIKTKRGKEIKYQMTQALEIYEEATIAPKKKRDDKWLRRGRASEKPFVNQPGVGAVYVQYQVQNMKNKIVQRAEQKPYTTSKPAQISTTADKYLYQSYEVQDESVEELTVSPLSAGISDELTKYDISSIFVNPKQNVPSQYIKRLSRKKDAEKQRLHRKPQINGRRMMKPLNYHDFSHYKSWRRQLGVQHNNLTVGIFGYVNLGACKKIVERSLPPLYEIKNKNEVLCYSSDEFFITNEDSGAPVVQADQLVAVTVGGVDSQGEHVAVGMKITCFCSWIADNLPKNGGTNLKCCKNCCNGHKVHAKVKKVRKLNTNLPSSKLSPKRPGMYKFVNEESDSDRGIDKEAMYASSE